jgi:hypothetical protein
VPLVKPALSALGASIYYDTYRNTKRAPISAPMCVYILEAERAGLSPTGAVDAARGAMDFFFAKATLVSIDR